MNFDFGRRVTTLAILALTSVFSAQAQEMNACGSLENAYGPFDYYVDKDKLPVVERHHFTPNVEFLRKELTSTFGGDIDYTLRAFPNHPRALATMIRLGEREESERPRGANYTIYCYLDRAIRFRPEDGAARLMLGTYLVRHKRRSEATEHLEAAVRNAGENANLHYNLGLVLFDLQDYEKALWHAQKAYALGYDLPGLRKKLESAGKWAAPAIPVSGAAGR